MTPHWQAAGVSATGARHAVDGSPCQDAVCVYLDRELAIVAVADGHGDPKHARSAEGARIAVEVLAALFRDLGKELLAIEGSRNPVAIEEDLKHHLPRRLCWEWNRMVKAHAGLSGDGEWHEGVQLYGSTVLGALFTKKTALFLQLGDGDILMVGPNGTESVFPLHEDFYGSLTHSLCQPGCADLARLSCRRLERPTLAVLATDGIRDSLGGEDDLAGIGAWLLKRLQKEGWEPVIEALPAWLEELSRRGNGDDATMGLVYWRKR